MVKTRYEATSVDGSAVGKVAVGEVLIDEGHDEPGEWRQWDIFDFAACQVTGSIVGEALGPHTPEQIEREAASAGDPR